MTDPIPADRLAELRRIAAYEENCNPNPEDLALLIDEIDRLAELHELATKIDDDQIGNHLRCLGCLIEQHQGTRDEANPAAAIVGGQSTCLEHLQFADGPALPGRTASGLILGNGA